MVAVLYPSTQRKHKIKIMSCTARWIKNVEGKRRMEWLAQERKCELTVNGINPIIIDF